MAVGDESWQRLIQGLRDGDPDSVQEFCAHYGEKLQRLAEKHLPHGLRRRLGPEDVVQSACRTFLRRAQDGKFQFGDAENLWALLCAITLTKVREQARFHLRQKRGLDREQQLDSDPQASGASRFEPIAPGPSPDEAAEFADQLQHVLASLDEEERQVVDLRLQEYSTAEMAERLGCSERTIRRLLKRVQAHLARTLSLPPGPKR
jgi:RNA polymerase sigma factor (sigma-70 family)